MEGLASGRRLDGADVVDLVLALIEDAHSADPVLFGAGAADHFARLHAARSRLERRATGAMVPVAGIEPATFGLQNRCSTS